jgi:serine/threonine protein phosphatase PrpC
VLRADGLTDKGRIRPTNQDRFAVDDGLGLCVVADGMGGHKAGEIAAQLAVDAVVGFVRNPDRTGWPFGIDPALSEAGNRIRTAIHLAHLQILEEAGVTDEYAGMGTTIVAALVVGDRAAVGHVGDSRLYRFTGGRLRQLTDDDSWMASMLAHNPQADPIALLDHPLRNALTNVVGARSGADVHVVEEQLADGDSLLLTTDGVHGVLDEGGLALVLAGDSDPARAAATIVQTAIARGSRDNCTAVVARYNK